MKFCEHCGARIDDGVRFCANCGAPAPQTAPLQQPSAMPPMPSTTQAPPASQPVMAGFAPDTLGAAESKSAAPGMGLPPTGASAQTSVQGKHRNLIIVAIAAVAVVVIALGAFFLTRPTAKSGVNDSAAQSEYPVGQWSLHMKTRGADITLIAVSVGKDGKASLHTSVGTGSIDIIDGKLGKPDFAGGSATYHVGDLKFPHAKQPNLFSDNNEKVVQPSSITLTMPRKGIVGDWRVVVRNAGAKSSGPHEFTMKVGADHSLVFGWKGGYGVYNSGVRSGVWSTKKSDDKSKQRFGVEMESGNLMDDEYGSDDDDAGDEADMQGKMEFYLEAPQY
ncbi:zinc-ribbon domain-containing protein [Bifidobacterium sp. ESL0800]|uniref:zinc ribbon domain-containing protein n=1 Tax=Bifidobacterium sp. ESL0800 TaxID=2983236 RepID=UPI0023F97A43|nr:zinc-ribbon domain-containing protein [Bifidobacterium sp. ESL0800]WEV75570.1 zinc-ribbon domain-containing protein [Bifidobacterium sp. ESL0800]